MEALQYWDEASVRNSAAADIDSAVDTAIDTDLVDPKVQNSGYPAINDAFVGRGAYEVELHRVIVKNCHPNRIDYIPKSADYLSTVDAFEYRGVHHSAWVHQVEIPKDLNRRLPFIITIFSIIMRSMNKT